MTSESETTPVRLDAISIVEAHKGDRLIIYRQGNAAGIVVESIRVSHGSYIEHAGALLGGELSVELTTTDGAVLIVENRGDVHINEIGEVDRVSYSDLAAALSDALTLDGEVVEIEQPAYDVEWYIRRDYDLDDEVSEVTIGSRLRRALHSVLDAVVQVTAHTDDEAEARDLDKILRAAAKEREHYWGDGETDPDFGPDERKLVADAIALLRKHAKAETPQLSALSNDALSSLHDAVRGNASRLASAQTLLDELGDDAVRSTKKFKDAARFVSTVLSRAAAGHSLFHELQWSTPWSYKFAWPRGSRAVLVSDLLDADLTDIDVTSAREVCEQLRTQRAIAQILVEDLRYFATASTTSAVLRAKVRTVIDVLDEVAADQPVMPTT